MDYNEEQENKVKNRIVNYAKRSVGLRTKDREFHGLEREFYYYQTQMLFDYDKTKDLHHIRYKGDARENILRDFLCKSGLLPKKYFIPETSTRVVSSHGFSTQEIDILLIEKNEAMTLMDRYNSIATYPIECCYGIIQIKSQLNRNELNEAFDNISSFKRLKKLNDKPFFNSSVSDHGFGIIFAYDSDLKWGAIVNQLEKLSSKNKSEVLPNAIFILNKGFFIWGDEKKASCLNELINLFDEIKVYGFPDRNNQCLYHFYSILITLLRKCIIENTPIDAYYRLPLTAGSISYNFVYEFMSDSGVCENHGNFSRKISEENIIKVLDYCKSNAPLSNTEFFQFVYGVQEAKDIKNSETKIWVYNPNELPFSDILCSEIEKFGCRYRSITFDHILCEKMNIAIPYYYSIKQGIINGCPQCEKSGNIL